MSDPWQLRPGIISIIISIAFLKSFKKSRSRNLELNITTLLYRAVKKERQYDCCFIATVN